MCFVKAPHTCSCRDRCRHLHCGHLRKKLCPAPGFEDGRSVLYNVAMTCTPSHALASRQGLPCPSILPSTAKVPLAPCSMLHGRPPRHATGPFCFQSLTWRAGSARSPAAARILGFVSDGARHGLASTGRHCDTGSSWQGRSPGKGHSHSASCTAHPAFSILVLNKPGHLFVELKPRARVRTFGPVMTGNSRISLPRRSACRETCHRPFLDHGRVLRDAAMPG